MSKKFKYIDAKLPSDFQVNEYCNVAFNQDLTFKDACVTAVKFSQGGHIHYDLVFVTHFDDDGTKNYQNLYHVQQGFLFKLKR